MKLASSILLGLVVGFLQLSSVFPYVGHVLKSKTQFAANMKPLTPLRIKNMAGFTGKFAVQGSIDDSNDSNGSDKTPFFLTPAFQSKLKIVIPVAIVGALGYVAATSGLSIDFSQLLESAVSKVEGLGPLGYLYFSAVRIIDRILFSDY